MTNPTGSSSPDFYSVLGIAPDADQKTIRAAYRRRAREAHPDQGGSAEDFHRVQEAWETLGSEESRSVYDRARGTSGGPTPEEDSGLDGGTYARGRTWTASTSGAAHSPGGRRDGTPKPSGASQKPPVYEPELSSPEPLSLPLTSQRVHGEFASRGLFGGGRTQRRHRRSIELLTKHLLDELPAARLFNDVHLEPAAADRKGRRRAPRGGKRAEHVMVCGDALIVLGVHEVAASAASWDGRTLRAAGRAVTLPNLAAQARRLRETLTQRLAAEYGHEPALTISHQMMLLSTDGSLLSPVVEGAAGHAPLAAGRAVRRALADLAVSERANVVDRRLLAALRDQLAAPDAG